MQYSSELIPAILIKRYKRFLADVELPDGSVITVHSPNTGSMMGCAEPGMRVWIRDTNNPKRKYRFAWEQSQTGTGTCININTILTNHLVREAIERGRIDELRGYDTLRGEVAYGRQGSRIDLLLERGPEHSREQCFVEAKNVTAREEVEGRAVAIFPDAVTQRGTKHLQELMHMVEQGHRAVIFFCLSRDDVEELRPADAIDPLYGETLRQALAKGVEALAYRVVIDEQLIELRHAVPVVCP